MRVRVEFSGGLELLMQGRNEAELDLAEGSLVRDLIVHVRDHMIQERPELFSSGDTVRPGILVLINECDWELEGEAKYALQEGDTVTFISTLHGG